MTDLEKPANMETIVAEISAQFLAAKQALHSPVLLLLPPRQLALI